MGRAALLLAVLLAGAAASVRAQSPICDYSIGLWVRDSNRAYYDPKACGAKYLDGVGVCKSKRNQDYQNWRWQPHGCNLPRMTPEYLAQKLRGVKMLMVGDSLMKNHFNTMLCTITTLFKGKYAVEVDESRGGATRYSRWVSIKELDARITEAVSVHLCPEPEGRHAPDPTGKDMRVDCSRADPAWANIIQEHNVAVFTTGHWWGTTLKGTFERFTKPQSFHTNFTPEAHVPGSPWTPLRDRIRGGEVFLHEEFRKTLFREGRIGHQEALAMLVDQTRDFKGQLIYQTTTPTHFWAADTLQGSCNQWLQPWKDSEVIWQDKYFQAYVREVDVFRPLYPRWKFLDVTHLSLLRPDAHPSVSLHDVKKGSAHAEDCSHFCLGSTVDAWMEIMLTMVDPVQQ